ncbi:MAG TPA: hypothetical protein VHQ96_04580 [Gaiellaceae bacterium]|nr:hypothetical protein [Gaiellaceae bacterium]
MAIFRRRSDDSVARDEVHREETDGRGWGSPPLVRALFTLLGVGGAGLLIWLAQTFDLTSTNGFWAAMGLIAGAGLALGLSQLFGGWTKWGLPVMSPGVFLLAFIPTAIVVGWILLATQPQGGWQQDRFVNWSSDLGITGLVNDLGTLPAALAMGLGIVFAFTFDTTGPRTREEHVELVERDTVPDEDVHDYDTREEVVPATTTAMTDVDDNDRTMVPAGDTGSDGDEIRDPERRETP